MTLKCGCCCFITWKRKLRHTEFVQIAEVHWVVRDRASTRARVLWLQEQTVRCRSGQNQMPAPSVLCHQSEPMWGPLGEPPAIFLYHHAPFQASVKMPWKDTEMEVRTGGPGIEQVCSTGVIPQDHQAGAQHGRHGIVEPWQLHDLPSFQGWCGPRPPEGWVQTRDSEGNMERGRTAWRPPAAWITGPPATLHLSPPMLSRGLFPPFLGPQRVIQEVTLCILLCWHSSLKTA